MTGSWMSHQMVGTAPLNKFFGGLSNNVRKMVNILPLNMAPDTTFPEIIYHELEPNKLQFEYFSKLISENAQWARNGYKFFEE